MTTGKTIALTRWTFVGKVTSLLFNMLSRLVITFLPRSKCLLICLNISFLDVPVYIFTPTPIPIPIIEHRYICTTVSFFNFLLRLDEAAH